MTSTLVEKGHRPVPVDGYVRKLMVAGRYGVPTLELGVLRNWQFRFYTNIYEVFLVP